jgi:threonine synthase
MTIASKSFVTHLSCGLTGQEYPAREIHGLSEAGRPLLVHYDLDAVKSAVSKDDLKSRAPDMWRLRELLPYENVSSIVTLGETQTPLIPCNRLAKSHGVGAGKIIVKDEGRLPTGSFKARGLAMAVTMAKELGINRIAMPTNGNAGAALAAYCSNVGMESFIFCPDDTPKINILEIALQGGNVYTVNGLINDCGKIVGEGKEKANWFDLSTLKEPYRIEGKKTMGLELAEQMGWELPDVIFYPTGGGTGLIGMWKAFNELKTMGWITGDLPRMVAVQADGCAPIVKAWADGEEHAPLWEPATTHAMGIRVPIAVGDFLIIRAMRESNGFGITVSEQEILDARVEAGQKDGIHLCPEGAATLAAYLKALDNGDISKNDKAILFNCGSGLKYDMPEAGDFIDKNKPIDYSQF